MCIRDSLIFFLGIYCLVPDQKENVKAALPGAVFSTAGWMLFSLAFSMYFNFTGGKNYSYKMCIRDRQVISFVFSRMAFLSLASVAKSRADALSSMIRICGSLKMCIRDRHNAREADDCCCAACCQPRKGVHDKGKVGFRLRCENASRRKTRIVNQQRVVITSPVSYTHLC